MRTHALSLALALTLLSGSVVSAQKKPASGACRPQGVWQLVQTTFQGKTQQANTFQQWKLVTKDHWAWLAQDLKRDTLPMKTPADSLRAYFMNGGAGTYTVQGSTYTEKIDFFNDQALIGKSLPANCRMEGDRWYHSWDNAVLAAPGAPHDTMVEVWRRVE